MAGRLPLPLVSLLLLLLAASCAAQVPSPRFQCNGTTKCEALVGYLTDNETTYDAIRILFQVKSIPALYGFNNLSATTHGSTRVPAGTLVKVPFPCACANGTGTAAGRPVYTVARGDIMYDIANQIFKGFVTFQQIAAANNVPNASLIDVGDRLRIPLPCSCDRVDGVEAVHLAHLVPRGGSLSEIANQFGTTLETLTQINNISDPKDLQAGQVLDVPLTVCNSSIRRDSSDYQTLRVPVGSYALTAKNCVRCSCSSSSSQLQCNMAPALNKTRPRCQPEACPAGGPTSLGDAATNSCGTTRCEYAGFNSSVIFTTLVSPSTCGAPPPGSPGSGGGEAGAPPPGSPGSGGGEAGPPPPGSPGSGGGEAGAPPPGSPGSGAHALRPLLVAPLYTALLLLPLL